MATNEDGTPIKGLLSRCGVVGDVEEPWILESAVLVMQHMIEIFPCGYFCVSRGVNVCRTRGEKSRESTGEVTNSVEFVHG